MGACVYKGSWTSRNTNVCGSLFETSGPPPRVLPEDPDIQWLQEDGKRYAGEWLAIEEGNLLAHGPDIPLVAEQAKQQGGLQPLIVRSPAADAEAELPFGGW